MTTKYDRMACLVRFGVSRAAHTASAKPRHPGCARPSRSGLTLLELLLVVFILAMLALGAASVTNRLDEQFRYEETQRRLEQIRRAVVGEPHADADGRRVLSGYVADVGATPPNIDVLTVSPAEFQADGGTVFALQAPIFDAEPATDGLNDGGEETPLSEPGQLLPKGFRGPYVTLPVGLERTYRDGWGNVASDPMEDARNHGWLVDESEAVFAVTSVGADGAVGDMGRSTYDADVSMELQADGWSVDIHGWTVEVENTIPSQAADNLRVSLLVYSDGQWRRFTTHPRVDLTLGQQGDSKSEEMTFDSTAANWPSDGTAPIRRVPIGQHLLVLVQDNNPTMHDGESTPQEIVYDADQNPSNDTQAITSRVTFLPRAARPNVKLVIE